MGAKYRVLEHSAINEYGDYFREGYGDVHTVKRIGQIVEASENQEDLYIFRGRPAVRVLVPYGTLEIPLDVLEGPLANWEVELLSGETVYEESADSIEAWENDPWEDSAYDEYDDSPAEEHDGSQDRRAFAVGDKVLFNEVALRKADDLDRSEGGTRGFAKGILTRGLGEVATVTNANYSWEGDAPIELELADGSQAWAEPEWLRHEDDPIGVVGGEATAITDGIVSLPEGMKPAPRDGGYLVIDGEIAGTYDKPVKSDSRGLSYSFSILPDGVNPDAPSVKDLSASVDLSEFVSSLSFSIAEPEAVDHPAHYGGEDDPYEVIKVIEAWGLDYLLGNALKYIRRAGKKSTETEVRDLRKAAWHINRKADNLEADDA